MSYYTALEAAGAEVLAFEQFGSYQGDWYAKVRFNGEEGWVTGCYGSCSGCDAFEGEFGWSYGQGDTDEYKKALAAFGKTYLDTILPAHKQVELLENSESWYYDDEKEAILKFIRDTK